MPVRGSGLRDYGHPFPVHWVKGMEEALDCSCISDSIPTPTSLHTHQQHMSHHTPWLLPASREHKAPAPLKIFTQVGGWGGVVKNQETKSLCELIKYVPVCISVYFSHSHFGLGVLLLTTTLREKNVSLIPGTYLGGRDFLI